MFIKKIVLFLFVIFGVATTTSFANIDISTTNITSPVSPMYGAINQTVIVTIKNQGTDTILFSSNNALVTVNVTGASTQSFNITLNSGSLLPGDTLNVNVTNLCNLSVAGTHIFNATTTILGDSNTGNDALSSPINIVVMTVDVGITAITAPSSPLCPASNQTITVTVNNFSSSAIDFTIKPVTINVTITGASSQTFNSVVNTGSLAPGASQSINITTACNLTAGGTHSFNASTSVSGDINSGNDGLNPTVNIVVNAVSSGTIASNQTICSGGDPVAFTESIASTGTGTLTYAWKSSADGYVSTLGTGTTFDAPAGITTATTFRRITTSTLGIACTDTSNDVLITVNNVTGGTIGVAQTICNGGDPSAFTESLASTGTGVLTYEWKNSTDGYTSTIGTGTTYDIPSGLTTTTTYRRITTSTLNGIACSTNSNDVTITVQGIVTGGTIASDQTICSGGDPVAFTESIASTGTGTLTYQWKNSTDGYTSTLGTNTTYDAPTGITATTTYRRITISTLGGTPCANNSNDVIVTVNGVTGGTIGTAQTICNGGDPAPFTEIAPATGTGTISYEWKSSADNYTATLGTNTTYDVSSGLTSTTTYRRIATSTLSGIICNVASNDITITVQDNVTAGSIASAQTVCSGGDPGTFIENIGATGSGTLSFAWKNSTDGYLATVSTASVYDIPPGITTTTTFRRIVTSTQGGVGCSATSNDVTVTVNDVTGGTIASAQTICGGTDPTAFSENAISTGSGTLSYEWKSSANGYTSVLGTATTYDSPALTTSTTFRRITTSTVGGVGCTANSNDIVITVNNITIGTIASAQTICNGGDPSIFTESPSTSSSGTLTYAWKSSADGYTATISTNALYNPPVLTTTTSYERITTSTLSGLACADTSNNITITVQAVVTSGTIASAQTICSGGNPAAFTVSVAATGSGILTYEWKSSANGYTTTLGTSATYDAPAGLTSATTFRRIVTSTVGTVGCTANSNDIVVSINDVTGGAITSAQTICSGGDPVALTENSASTGSGTLTYAWKKSTDSYTGTLGTNPLTYDPPISTATTTYRRITTSTLTGVSCTANSNDIVITVNLVTPGTINSNQTICYGGDPANFTSSPAATGTGTLTYEWKSSADSYVATIATTATYNAPIGLIATTNYRRIVTSTTGGLSCSAISNDITVTVNPQVIGGTIAASQTICSGGDPVAFTESVPSSGSGTITYQWKNSSDNYTATIGTGQTYDPPTLTASTTYRRITISTDGATCSANSNDVGITINTVTGGTVSSAQSICFGGNPVAFTQTASATGTGTLTYEWTSSDDGYSAILGTSTTYDVPNGLTSTTTYRRAVTSTLNGTACSVNSNDLTVTVQAALTGGTIASAQTVCQGGDPAAFTQTPPSGGVGTYTYQWKSSSDGYTATLGTSTTYNPPAGITATETYRRIAISTLGSLQCTATSNDIIVTVNNITGGTLASSQSICSGSDPIAFSEITPATTDGGTLSYEWKSSADGYSSVISTSATYDAPPGLTTTTSYIRIASSIFSLTTCAANSNTLTIYIDSPISNNIITAPQTICNGTAADTLTGTTPDGGNGIYSYVWVSSTTNSTSGFSSATGTNNNDNYIPGTLATTTWYKRKVTSCSGTIIDTSVAVQISVNQTPVATATNSSQTICSGTAFQTMVLGTSNSISGTTFAWSRDKTIEVTGIDSTNTGNIGGATLTNTSPNPITVTFTITPTGPAPSFCPGTPIITSIIVNPKPKLNSSLTDSICSNDTVMYTPTSLTSGTTFLWERGAITGISEAPANDTLAINEILTSYATFPLYVTYEYTLTANGCENIQNVLVAVNPVPTLNSDTSLINICSGATFSYTASSSSQNAIYTWTRNAVTGLSNASNTGGGSPNEILMDTTTAPVMTAYIYHVSANGCTNPYNYTIPVRVNPHPVLISTLNPSGVCSNTPFTYVPNSSTTGVNYTWTRPSVTGISNTAGSGTASINETLINTTNDTISALYIYSLSINGCNSDSNYNVVAMIYPEPTLTSSLSDTICSGGLFNYIPTSTLTGTVFNWTRSIISGISNGASSGTDTISETLVNTSTIPITTNYSYGLVAGGCNNTTPNVLSVTVLPPPVLTSNATPAPVCSGTAFNYVPSGTPSGITYTWTRDSIAGISNIMDTGLDTINETLVNTTAYPVDVTYIYTLSANGCSDSSNYNVVVKINPTPTLSSNTTSPAICSGSTFYYLPTSLTAGTTFSWSRALVQGISNPTTFGTNDPIEVLWNTTDSTINVNYLYTLTANNCSDTQSVTVAINPIPQLNSILNPTAICSGNVFNYIPTSTTTGASFSWTRVAIPGISNTTASGTDTINEVLLNTTTAPINVSYVYHVSANGCSNTTGYTVIVTVNPIPNFNSTIAPSAICSGNVFNYIPTGTTSGITYSWVRPIITGINNPLGSGTDTINEILTNTTTSPINATYIYTLSANGCSDSSNYNVVVTVNPTPTLNSNLTPPAICSGTLFHYVPSSATANTTFFWSRSAITGISNSSSIGVGDPAEALFDTTTQTVNVTYLYTLSANNCADTQSVVVAVNPIPQLSSNLTPTSICSNSVFTYSPTSLTSNASFTWTKAIVSGISNLYSSGTDNPNETLINTTTFPINVSYIYTTSSNGCSGSDEVIVKVDPLPLFTSNINPSTICSGETFNYLPASQSTNTVFTWARSAITGISNPADTGTDTINEVLVNTTTLPINVTYIYTLSSNGCVNPTSYSISVAVNPTPSLYNSISTTSTCSNVDFVYNFVSQIPGSVITWNRAVVAGISNLQATGINSINEVLLNTTTLPIEVIYEYTIITNECTSAIDSITVTVNPPALGGTLSGNLGAVCSGSNLGVLTLNGHSGNIIGWEYSTNNGGSWANINNTSTLLSYNNLTTNTLYHALVQIANCPIVQSENDTIFIAPTITTGTVVGSETVCSGSNTGTLTLTGYTGSIQSWLLSTDLGVSWVSTQETSSSYNYNNLIATTWYATVIQSGACTDTSTISIVNVKPTPTISFSADTVCEGSFTTFNPVSSITNGSINNYMWDFGDFTSYTSAISNDTISHAYNNIGSYSVSFTATSDYGCSTTIVGSASIIATANISIVSSPSPTSSGNTSLNASGGISYSWQPPESLDDASISNPLASPIATTTYTLTATDINGCISTDTITVSIGTEDAFLIPNLITPNGDGLNDTWKLRLLGNTSNIGVTILNAEGSTVFNSVNYQNEWDGTNNKTGKLLPDGTYYYFINLKESETRYKGTVTVLSNL
jgi:gliding motility-associated-like protein